MPIALRRLTFSYRWTIKLRLTLFLPPNQGFGESFCGQGRRRPHHFFISYALPEPARKLAETLDQGFRAVERLQSRTHVLQPCQIGLTGFVAQRQFGIFLLPK